MFINLGKEQQVHLTALLDLYCKIYPWRRCPCLTKCNNAATHSSLIRSWGLKSGKWEQSQSTPCLFTYTTSFIYEPYNIITCPLKAWGKTKNKTLNPSKPSLLSQLTPSHRHTGRWANGVEERAYFLFLFGGDLSPFSGNGVLHGLQLLQQLLAAGQRVAGFVGA